MRIATGARDLCGSNRATRSAIAWHAGEGRCQACWRNSAQAAARPRACDLDRSGRCPSCGGGRRVDVAQRRRDPRHPLGFRRFPALCWVWPVRCRAQRRRRGGGGIAGFNRLPAGSVPAAAGCPVVARGGGSLEGFLGSKTRRSWCALQRRRNHLRFHASSIFSRGGIVGLPAHAVEDGVLVLQAEIAVAERGKRVADLAGTDSRETPFDLPFQRNETRETVNSGTLLMAWSGAVASMARRTNRAAMRGADRPGRGGARRRWPDDAPSASAGDRSAESADRHAGFAAHVAADGRSCRGSPPPEPRRRTLARNPHRPSQTNLPLRILSASSRNEMADTWATPCAHAGRWHAPRGRPKSCRLERPNQALLSRKMSFLEHFPSLGPCSSDPHT